MPVRSDAVMRTANAILRLLIFLNIGGFVLIALFGAMTFHPGLRDAVVSTQGAAAADDILLTFRLVVLVVAFVVPLAHVLLSRLRDMVATVAAGDPFVPANAARLKTIAWCLLGIQLCDLAFGAVMLMPGAREEVMSGWTFSVTGWLAVLLLFVLARVFDQGARLRDDLAGTV
ncbi:DUF2975 domain-containing protein [Sphingosinicella terrae]|uniref:DUF2975 domain-containing protein n=1 Tax=Sphingosinicella terrae TaxID=2172047 RepID=UPI000E0D43EB|nr:DUF2975 domain-containing protein [Sphingosinicella terrae]